MNAQNTKKKYKFAFSGIVAILAGLVIAALTCLDFISEINSTFAKVSELTYPPMNHYGLPIVFPSQDFYYSIKILSSLLSQMHFISNICLSISMLIFGILLIAKQRKSILLLYPILSMVGMLLPLSIQINGSYEVRLFATIEAINFVWLLMLVAYILFFIFIKSTVNSTNNRKPYALVWIASAFIASSYGALTYTDITSTLYTWIDKGFDAKLLININLLTNAVSIFIYPTVFILAGLWIANPYKKNARTESETVDLSKAAETSKTVNAPKFAAPANVKAATNEKLGSQFDEKVDALKKCKELLDMNIITQEEFEEKKKQILDL